jgi:hypothetical protein
MLWQEERDARLGIAHGLDLAAERFGLQVAFFCNECCDGEFFDFEAAREIGGLMRSRSVLVPNEHDSADEAIALLRSDTVAVGARKGTSPSSGSGTRDGFLRREGFEISHICAKLWACPAPPPAASSREHPPPSSSSRRESRRGC